MPLTKEPCLFAIVRAVAARGMLRDARTCSWVCTCMEGPIVTRSRGRKIPQAGLEGACPIGEALRRRRPRQDRRVLASADQMSIVSVISIALSRYLKVLSIFECPSKLDGPGSAGR